MKTKKITALLLASLMIIGAVGCSSQTEDTTASSIDAAAASAAVADSVAGAVETMPTETTEVITLADCTHEDVYGSQFPQFMDHQYYFDSEPVNVSESNFYMINSFTEFNNYAQYGYYPVTPEGFFDLSATIETMDGEELEYNTYDEFLISYTEQVLHSTLVICKFCEEEGITLDEETVNQINEMVDSLEDDYAAPEEMEFEDYIHLFYGDASTADGLKQALYNYYLAEYYTGQYIDNYELTEEEAQEANPIVRYALYYAPAGSSDEDLAAAEALANDTLAQCAGDIDAFPEIGSASQAIGDSLEYGELSVALGQFVPGFEEWAWDPARTEGELDIIYTEEFGYFVVGFVGRDKADFAISALGDLVSSLFDQEGYLLTSDPYAPAVPVEAPETEATTTAPVTSDATAGTSVLTADDLANIGTEEKSENTASKIIITSLACIGGAAILGLAGVGVASIVKGNKATKSARDEANAESSEDSEEE